MTRQQWLEATTVIEFACTCLVGLVWIAFSPVTAAKTGIVAFGLAGIWAALALLGEMAQRGARVGLGGLAVTLAMHLVKPAILLYFVHSVDDAVEGLLNLEIAMGLIFLWTAWGLIGLKRSSGSVN
ncbi:hypothetical protein [Pseudomonas aeruginosa]|uniref:hypothetical protein n=1 Tax=Pseudomonas aeruginosa TaxID=287 RepID=UPI0005CC96CD|nr:hypothetical protein [Pseudomonas aeruginosa]KJC15028.1 hypothetical protein TN45_31115 [Pseudomonas aeruginosa]RTU52152.1 hypothetical protein DZA25_29615 [Pseudomonas aeruginosa]